MSTLELSRYLQENPGADFVAAFIVSLIVIALVYPFSRDIAEKIASFAFFSLVAGVILQALSMGRR